VTLADGVGARDVGFEGQGCAISTASGVADDRGVKGNRPS
jgi:NifU-like protein involved in Fe-S cluster formation